MNNILRNMGEGLFVGIEYKNINFINASSVRRNTIKE